LIIGKNAKSQIVDAVFSTAYAIGLTSWFSNLSYALASHLSGGGFRHCLSVGSPYGNAVLFIVVLSLTDYWVHRTFHGRRLWPLHRMHHSATVLWPAVQYRHNPLYILAEPLLRFWPLSLVSLSPGWIAAIILIDQAHQILSHLNVPWTWG